MLKTNKVTTINGQSFIDGKQAEGYQATINTENPEEMTISSWQTDKQLYKNNREICRQDRAAFEEIAYEIQNEMMPKEDSTDE